MRSIAISMLSTLCTTTLALGGAACVETDDEAVDDEVALGDSEQAIEDGSAASAWQLARAADLGNCTGTRIGSRHVLTALHCSPRVGNTVRFYTTGPAADPSTQRTITAVSRPGCTQWDATTHDWTDCGGDFADFAVVTLDAPVTVGTAATLAWAYPGSDRVGQKVGAGNHEDVSNLGGVLLQRSDYTYSDDDGGGGFLTNQAGVNPGDSGGPFYYGGRVLGTLTGKIVDIVWRGRHTSVPHHLDAILARIGYAWAGDPVESGTYRTGTVASFLVRSEQVCKYACEKTSSCVAFNHLAGLNYCYLLSSVTDTSSLGGWRSATR